MEHYLRHGKLAKVDAVPCPYGTGDAGQQIAALLRRGDVRQVVAPRELETGMPGPQVLAEALGAWGR